MLILKSPLQLRTITPMKLNSERMMERIANNYQMMSLSISPEDLLHMTTLQPEVYVAIENENHLLVENQLVQKNETKIEMINQLLNRLQLYHTPMFSYQDEVFVSSVLQKLGITNVEEFMKQISQNEIRNEQSLELIEKYYVNEMELKRNVEEVLSKNENLVQKEQSDYWKKEETNQVWNDIFIRLKTAQISNSLYDFETNLDYSNKKSQEFNLIQQICMADQLQQFQLKQRIYENRNETLCPLISYYEEAPAEDPDITRESVLGQLAAAMLIQMSQEISYQKNTRYENGEYQWQNFTQAFYGSTTDVIERFEKYQSVQQNDYEQIKQCDQVIQKLRKEETELLNLVDYLEEEEEKTPALEMASEKAAVSLLENQNMQQQLLEVMRLVQMSPRTEAQKDHIVIDQERLVNQIEAGKVLYELHQIIDQKYQVLYQDIVQKYTMNQSEAELLYPDEGESEESLRIELEKAAYIKERERSQLLEKIEVLSQQNEATDKNVAQEDESDSKNPLAWIESIQNNYNLESDEDYYEYVKRVNEKNEQLNQLILEENKDEEQGRQIVLDKKSARKNALRALEDPKAVLEEIYAENHSIPSEADQKIEKYLKFVDQETKNFYYHLLNQDVDQAVLSKIKFEEASLNEGSDSDTISEKQTPKENEVPKEASRWIEEVRSRRQMMLLNLVADQFREAELQERKEISGNQELDQNAKAQMSSRTTGRNAVTDQIMEVLHRQRVEENPEEIRLVSLFLKEHREMEPEKKEKRKQIWKEEIEEHDLIPKEILLHQERSGKLITEDSVEQLNLIHQTSSQLDEETIADIKKSIHEEQVQVLEQQNVIREEHQVEQIKSETKQQITRNQEINIAELIQQNLRTQLGTISNQVYQKLEKRLESERRRRGY